MDRPENYTNWTHTQILAENPLSQTILHPNLGDRLKFIALFPMYLVQQANDVEKMQHVATPHLTRSSDFSSDGVIPREMLGDQDESKRAMALEMTSRSSVSQIPSEFWQSVSEESSYVKIVTLHTLRNQPQKFLTYTLQLLQDENELVRLVAIKNLADFQNPQILPHLYQLLSDPSGIVRGQTIGILADMNFVESIPHLWPLLEDSEPYVRKNAKDALVRLTGKKWELPEQDQKRREAISHWKNWWENRPDR